MSRPALALRSLLARRAERGTADRARRRGAGGAGTIPCRAPGRRRADRRAPRAAQARSCRRTRCAICATWCCGRRPASPPRWTSGSRRRVARAWRCPCSPLGPASCGATQTTRWAAATPPSRAALARARDEALAPGTPLRGRAAQRQPGSLHARSVRPARLRPLGARHTGRVSRGASSAAEADEPQAARNPFPAPRCEPAAPRLARCTRANPLAPRRLVPCRRPSPKPLSLEQGPQIVPIHAHVFENAGERTVGTSRVPCTGTVVARPSAWRTK